MKILYMFFIVLFLSGCTKTVPPITNYTLDTHISTNSNKQCLQNIKILKAFGISNINSLNMSYMQGKYTIFNYNQSKWNQYPSQTITDEFVKNFKKANLFKSVIGYRSRADADLLLELHVDDFMQHFSKDLSKSFAKITIDINLIRTKDSKIIYTKRFQAITNAKTLDAKGGVEALNISLQKIIQQSITDIQKVCK